MEREKNKIMITIKLYDKNNIDELPLIDNYDAKYATSYLVPMVKNGVEKFFDNVQGEMKILCIDNEWLLPVFVPKINKTNAYVASIYSHYISYCFDELGELKNPFLQGLAKIILHILGALLKTAQIDKCVFVNNWLLSTNLYTNFPVEYIKPITEFVAQAHKDYSVAWNSINNSTTKEIYEEMQTQNYLFVPSRSIYILSQFEGFSSVTTCELRRDKKLLDESPFHFEKTSYDKDIIKLYNNLYIDKYSHFNPKFNNEFAKLAGGNELLEYYVLKKGNGENVASLGYFARQGIMTTPIVGYDFSYDKSVGLYRQLSIKLFSEAKENGYILNHSSGVGRFKMKRGAKRHWEYRVFYTKNINFYRRFIHKLLQLALNKVGVPMMDKKKL